MMRSTRQSKRPRPSDSKEEASSSGPTKAKKLSTRVSSRNLNNCIEFGIPESLCCSSCQKYIEIDACKQRNRPEYPHHSFQCWKPYEDDAQCLKKPRNKVWLQKLDAWFASRNINWISLFVVDKIEFTIDDTSNNKTSVIKETTNHGCPLPINVPDPSLVVEDNNPPQQESEPAQQPQQKPKKSIPIEDKTVKVQGKDHIIQDVPKTHVVIHRSYLKRLQNKESQIDELRQSVGKKKYTGTPLSKRLLASGLALVPGLSLTGAELVIPLVVFAFLADLHLIDDQIDLELFSKLFVSARNLRNILISFAVDSLIEVGNQINGADNVFLSCDKGNKKGLSHLVKILSWWDKTEKKVQTFVLDIDASEGRPEGCTEAIQHSLKKVNNTTITLPLKGQTTDSDGGGVLESLGNQLQERDLCSPTYLVASCTLHAIQIALTNPVKKAMGEGSLGARTMMQMLHSASDLQELMEYSEFRLVMEEAKQWVEDKQNNSLPAHDTIQGYKTSCSTLGIGSTNSPCLTERVKNCLTGSRRSPSLS
jgi:hypothetical protein